MRRKRNSDTPPALLYHGKYEGELAGMLDSTDPDYCDKVIFAVIENRLLEVKDHIDHAVEKLREKPFSALNEDFMGHLVCIDAEIKRVKKASESLVEDDSREVTEIPPPDFQGAKEKENRQ